MASEWQTAKAKGRAGSSSSAGARGTAPSVSAQRTDSREICQHYKEGMCAYGDNCWKRHSGPVEAISARQRFPPQVPSSDPRYKTLLCAFHPAGVCGRGRECSFAHSREELIQHQRSSARKTGGKEAGNPKRASAPSTPPSIDTQRARGKKSQASESILEVPVPENFAEIDPVCCPITQDVFEQPTLMSDGFSYERSAIVGWLQRSNRSPMTNEPLAKAANGEYIMVPNHTLKALVGHAIGRQL